MLLQTNLHSRIHIQTTHSSLLTSSSLQYFLFCPFYELAILLSSAFDVSILSLVKYFVLIYIFFVVICYCRVEMPNHLPISICRFGLSLIMPFRVELLEPIVFQRRVIHSIIFIPIALFVPAIPFIFRGCNRTTKVVCSANSGYLCWVGGASSLALLRWKNR